MGKLRVFYRDGRWDVRGGETVVTFASSTDAWAYKREHEKVDRARALWRRLRKAA